MNEILFATGNERKVAEARAACDDFSITDAYSQIQSPVVINDTSWSIPALNGFPGGYMKDVAEWFTPENFINLVASSTDRRICITEVVIYKDADTTKVFRQEYVGRISTEPRGSGNSVEQIAEFDGLTLAEQHDQGKFSHDPKDYIWYEFAQWFAKK
jgi:XTP/dITP diphosphohydrolase